MDEEHVLESELLDVSDLDLAKLDALPGSALHLALRRVLAESEVAPDSYAAFESAL